MTTRRLRFELLRNVKPDLFTANELRFTLTRSASRRVLKLDDRQLLPSFVSPSSKPSFQPATPARKQAFVSVWPVRGGPVVDDGIVYFAAGVLPFEGVFVYAMEMTAGNVVWRNGRLGYMYGQQPHNLYFAEPEALGPKHRLQGIKLQGRNVVYDFDIADEADGVMRGIVKEFSSIEVKNDLTLELSATNGKTIISGVELIRQD